MYSIPESVFLRELNKLHEDYDEKENMMIAPFSSPGYHTTLKGGMVHRTRESLEYAVALLDSGREEYIPRAAQILEKVISLQDTNPENKTYGIWSWFLEEPLTQMAPPDWNWADFCGKQLVKVAHDHFDKLDTGLRERVKASVIHACKSIMLRNVGPGYTNISLMGTYVTHVAGELFENEEILAYAKKRLETLYRYNMKNGEFNEYNSPTYTVVAIEEISSMLAYIKDPDSLRRVKDLNEMAWGCLARHFHLPTWQWAGPHDRCYTNLLTRKILSLIQLGTKGQVAFVKEEELEVLAPWIRMDLQCPEKFYPYFTCMPSNRVEKKVFSRENDQNMIRMENGYFTGKYVLSSFNNAIFWNQRRALLAYFGTPGRPAYMQLRCLHDGYDYCSANLQCVQEKNQVIGVVNFYTDGGDTHPSLDMLRNGTIKARDLRLRLEFGGHTENIRSIEKVEDAFFTVGLEEVKLSYFIPEAQFGDFPIRCEKGAGEGKLWVDVILYEGEEQEINFQELEKAYTTFALIIHPAGSIPTPGEVKGSVSVRSEKEKVELMMKGEEELRIEAPTEANTFKKLIGTLKGFVNGIPYEETANQE